jgi:hypothetical protein
LKRSMGWHTLPKMTMVWQGIIMAYHNIQLCKRYQDGILNAIYHPTTCSICCVYAFCKKAYSDMPLLCPAILTQTPRKGTARKRCNHKRQRATRASRRQRHRATAIVMPCYTKITSESVRTRGSTHFPCTTPRLAHSSALPRRRTVSGRTTCTLPRRRGSCTVTMTSDEDDPVDAS